MTKFPEDDQPLKEFLRQNASTPPPAAPNLETRIMQAVASSSDLKISRRRHLWLVPSALAASLLTGWAVYRAIVPPPLDNAALEAFMTDNWDSVVVGEGTETDWLQVQ